MSVTTHETSNSDVLLAEFDDESVLLDTNTGHYFAVNATALEIWKLCQAKMGNDDIVDHLAGNFHVSRSQAKQDVDAFMLELSAAGLRPS